MFYNTLFLILCLIYFSLISNWEKAHKECLEKGSSPLRHGIRKKVCLQVSHSSGITSKGNTVSLREGVSSPVALHRTNEIHSSATPATSWNSPPSFIKRKWTLGATTKRKLLWFRWCWNTGKGFSSCLIWSFFMLYLLLLGADLSPRPPPRHAML